MQVAVYLALTEQYEAIEQTVSTTYQPVTEQEQLKKELHSMQNHKHTVG